LAWPAIIRVDAHWVIAVSARNRPEYCWRSIRLHNRKNAASYRAPAATIAFTWRNSVSRCAVFRHRMQTQGNVIARARRAALSPCLAVIFDRPPALALAAETV